MNYVETKYTVLYLANMKLEIDLIFNNFLFIRSTDQLHKHHIFLL